MDVVGHEAIGQDFNPEFLAVFLEPRQIRCTIFVREKDVFAAVSALRDVVGNTSKYGSGEPGHGRRLT